MVVTDPTRAIIATDCFPLPALHSEANAPLIEYHVVLETGKPAYGIAAKIARTFLDSAVNGRLGNLPASVVPRPAGTCLMLYARGHADLHVPTLLKSSPVAAAEAVFLDRQAMVHRASGRVLPLPAFLAETQARHLLLLESGTHLRPDFWSIIADHGFRLQDTTDLIHWPSIWMDGLSRPQVVKSGLLMHPAFEFHALLEARSMLVRREAMVDAVQQQPELWRSGRLVLEKALCGVAAERVATVPTVMDIVRVPIAPLVQQRFESEQVALPQHPGSTGRPRPHAGVSLIINYRDAVDDTLRCLQAVRAQDANGPLEIVLVNNGSTSQSTARILGRARELFGSDAVKPIDYPQRFNHSEQCNIAAVAARHDLLLMLSNDSCLRTPLAIARAAELAAVPWVGTCGFRVVGNEATKGRLQSLGLSLNERRYLFSGGSPLTSGLPPAFSLACTFEVIGNTFAAAMVRRDVYVSLDGLDSVAFPTSYNDIDFSFRALQAGYRHVVIGSEIVEHVGRGSREADQDLPIDQRIIERAPRLDVLTRIGFQQL
jgi:GT2 family glycosyltransferase